MKKLFINFLSFFSFFFVQKTFFRPFKIKFIEQFCIFVKLIMFISNDDVATQISFKIKLMINIFLVTASNFINFYFSKYCVFPINNVACKNLFDFNRQATYITIKLFLDNNFWHFCYNFILSKTIFLQYYSIMEEKLSAFDTANN